MAAVLGSTPGHSDNARTVMRQACIMYAALLDLQKLGHENRQHMLLVKLQSGSQAGLPHP